MQVATLKPAIAFNGVQYNGPSADGTNGQALTTDGAGNIVLASVGSSWGSITGTLSNQTDLNSALSARVLASALGSAAYQPTSAFDVAGSAATVQTSLNSFIATKAAASGLASLNASSLLTTSQVPAFIGDIANTAGSLTMTLPTVNANVGTWNNLTVNAKGLVTAGSNVSYLTANQTVTLSGDVTGNGATGISTTVGKINGTSLAGLATGILKNTTTTGVPTIAVAGTDYQSPITLTTTGTSGAATFSTNTLNIPNYTYTLPQATSSTLGGVTVDNTSITAAAGVITANAGGLAGTTLKSTVVTSSLTSVGTLTSLNASGVFTNSSAGAASTAVITTTAAPYSAGTTTTNFPQWYAIWGSPTAGSFSTSGTIFGCNAANAWAGDIANYMVNGTSKFRLSNAGVITNATWNGAVIGTAYMASPTTLGQVTSVNGITTTGTVGVSAIVGSSWTAAATTALSGLASFTPASDGLFLVSVILGVTAVTSTTLSTQIRFTNEAGTSTNLPAQYATVGGGGGVSVNAVGYYYGFSVYVRAKASNSISVSTVFTAGSTMTYDIGVTIIQVG